MFGVVATMPSRPRASSACSSRSRLQKRFGSGSRLDYIFVTPGLAPRLQGAHIDADNPASDHQPVWLELAP